MPNPKGNKTILRTQNVCKEFNKVRVLDNIDFDLKRGEVHSIVGENGAGKSTFIKILSGVHSPTQGDIIFNNQKVSCKSVQDSEKLGIRTVHQEINLVNFFNVVENIFVGNELEASRMGIKVLNKKEMRHRAKEVLDKLGVKLNLDKYIHQLDASMQRIIQISKVLIYNPEVIIFDEPTTALGESERRRLLKIIRDLKKRNIGIIFVSHNLEEVMEVSDRITVFKDGENMGTMLKEDATAKKIVNKMIGHKSYSDFNRTPVANKDKVLLKVEDLNTDILKNINFQVHEGEVIGIAGVMGAGKSEIANAIFGIDPVKKGDFTIQGKTYEPDPGKAVSRGIAFVPEERSEQGLVLGMDVKDNITLSYLDNWSKGSVIDLNEERIITERLIDFLKIKTTGPGQKVKFLSGGNQQKVVIGRWLSGDFSLGIFDEPTKGIDVKAKEDIYNQIDDLANKGKGIIFFSSYLPELINLTDRILVIRNGEFVGEFDPKKFTETEIMIAMVGGEENE